MTERALTSRLRGDIIEAFRQNLIPALVLQGLAAIVGVSFFFWAPVRPFFDGVAELKRTYGPWFAVLSTSLFGGLLPYSYLLLVGKLDAHRIGQGVFYCAIWAFMGSVVDLLYTQQGVWFGTANDWATIAKKVAFDQFVFSSLLSAPFLTIAYLWKDKGFDFAATRPFLNRELFSLHIPTTVLTNWLVWIPAVSVIYAMPLPLQVPLFNLVLCFWVLLLSVLKRETLAPS